MGSNWREVALGDIFNIKHGFAFKGEFFIEEKRNTILVTPGNFAIGGGFQKQKLKYYDGPIPDEYVLQPGKIIVTMTDLSKESDTLGFSAIVPDDEYTWLHNQRVGLLEFNKGFESDPIFINYLLRSHEYRSWVIGSASGTTVKHTSPSRIMDFKCLVPPIQEQRVIAHILGSLDDKIELNRKMNETLEAMAQALFKSWFVDFDPVIDNAIAAGNPIPEELQGRAAIREALGNERKPLPQEVSALFPSEFELTEEMGWVPKGWNVTPLSEMINIIGGGTPKTSISDYWNGNIPWFSVVDAPCSSDIFVIETEKHITQLGVDKSSTKILPTGTTIISARGTVGKCAMVGTPMAMNQSCYGIRGNEGISDGFIYYALREKVADLQGKSHGSVFDTITRDTFQNIFLPFSSELLTVKFEEQIKGLLDRVLINLTMSRSLSQLRDTLLPKLLSGEIRIPDAEKLAESAA